MPVACQADWVAGMRDEITKSERSRVCKAGSREKIIKAEKDNKRLSIQWENKRKKARSAQEASAPGTDGEMWCGASLQAIGKLPPRKLPLTEGACLL